MRKKVKVVLYFTLFLATFLMFTKQAEAAEALPPGYLVGDDTGLSVGTDGVYFIRDDNISSGYTFTRNITISNYSNKEGSFEINFVMNPEDKDHVPKVTGEVDLMKAVSVTLTYQGKQIYTGPIDGSGTPIASKKLEPISLGSLETGEVRTMKADFKVSDQYPASAWKNVNAVDFYWLFFAKRTKTTDTDSSSLPPTSGDTSSDVSHGGGTSTTPSSKPSIIGRLPQTGEDWRNVMLGVIGGILIICLVLVIAKKRHDQHKE